MKTKKLLILAITSFFIFAIYTNKNGVDKCWENYHEYESRLSQQCSKIVEMEIKKGNHEVEFIYARDLEVSIEDYLSMNDKNYSNNGLYITLKNTTHPLKEKYFHWIKKLASEGDDHFLSQSLEFCKIEEPEFNKETIVNIIKKNQEKNDINNPNMRNFNRLKEEFKLGSFYPCTPQHQDTIE